MAVTKVQFVGGTIGEIIKQLPMYFAEGFIYSGDILATKDNNYRLRLEKVTGKSMGRWEIVVGHTFEAQERINLLLSTTAMQPLGDTEYGARGVIQFMGVVNG